MIQSKEHLRVVLREKRNALPQERRRAAYASLNRTLVPLLKTYKAVLSFHSFSDEIDLTFVNLMLAEEGKLHLPKVEEDAGLKIYRVNDPSKELHKSKWGLWEPDPAVCLQIDIATIDCILVPGLGFDIDHHRIGYGKGHYDQLLAQCSPLLKTIGIGFKEQYCPSGLPFEPHDVPLDELKLF
jgi:5-formyltetrahydrofolate cyclo-ligase